MAYQPVLTPPKSTALRRPVANPPGLLAPPGQRPASGTSGLPPHGPLAENLPQYMPGHPNHRAPSPNVARTLPEIAGQTPQGEVVQYASNAPRQTQYIPNLSPDLRGDGTASPPVRMPPMATGKPGVLAPP